MFVFLAGPGVFPMQRIVSHGSLGLNPVRVGLEGPLGTQRLGGKAAAGGA